ncbi:MAG: prepilin peptidase [Oligoflexia bacterium]|nr:prepilin peptidase [Oligoflexia bacterium]
MISPEFVYGILIFILGACLGSFGNVIILRLPAGKSIVRPGSCCPHCKKSIKWFDNVPILAWFFLKGKCRQCGEPISPRYFIVELLSAVIFLALYLKFGLTITFIECALFAWAGLVASVIDLDHRILPDVFTLSGIIIGLIGAFINPDRTFLSALIGVIAGGGFLWLVATVYMAIRNEEGMGGGDIKLLAWIGAVLGWKAVIFSILVSSITGSIFGGVFAALQKSGLKTSIPFGPFLVFAALMYIFVGDAVMHSYLSIFFPFTE